MSIAGLGLAMLLILPSGLAFAQEQQTQPPSLSPAEAARRAREQKKEQPKAAKVWDEDTMPKTPGVVNVVGQSPVSDETALADAAAGNPDAGTAGATPGTGQAPSTTASSAQSDVTAAQEKLKALKADRDTLRRRYDLDSQMYYGKPNYSADKAGADRLADEQNQINAKQQEIDDAQKRLDDLETQAKNSQASGTPQEAPSNPPSNKPN